MKNWLSTDPEVLAHVAKFSAAVNEPAFHGLWATVNFQPDSFSPQTYCVGVVVGTPSRTAVFRLLEDLQRFECVYGKRGAQDFADYLRSAEETLMRATRDAIPLSEIAFETDNLHLSAPWAAAGETSEGVCVRLYTEVVAFEPRDERPKRAFLSLDTEQVRRLVAAEMKRIGGLAYERVAVEDARQAVIQDVNGVAHQLDFNLRKPRGAGSVVSAVYKTTNTIELNLLRADRDLRTYGAIRKLPDLAVFIMAPKPELFEAGDYSKVSEVIDETTWRLEQSGLRVETFEDAEPIARSVLAWAEA